MQEVKSGVTQKVSYLDQTGFSKRFIMGGRGLALYLV